MKKIDVSIIIVQYMVKKEVFESIKSIYKLGLSAGFEIIVVDNDEKKTIQGELRKQFSKVRYIKSATNIGFGAGNNLGAKYAKGEYLFFLNPDTELINNSIDQLIETFSQIKNVGIVSPLLVDKNLKPFKTQNYKELSFKNAIYSFSVLRNIFPNRNIYNDSSLLDSDMKTRFEVEAIPGAALIISKKLFKEVGGFNKDLFLYFEEYDISKKVRDLGYKLFIDPKVVFLHKVGKSTKYLKNKEETFNKSRFIYFKKFFGVKKALFLETVLKINKYSFIIFLILALAFFLRVNNLSQGMVFIGDQGWFYLSARDILLTGNIPLVGITSSHIWLHQGPLWTYMLSIPLAFFNFNPVSGGYFTAILGITTVFLIYKIGSELFSLKTGVIASLLYAVSPLVISFDRMPYHTSPIALFTTLYFYALFKLISGKPNFFPIVIFLIAILYNLELATFVLFFPFAILLVYGLLRQKSWVKKILDKKIIMYSLMSFIIPMLPILIYDFSNGFKQTFIFLGWTIYKPFSFFINHPTANFLLNTSSVISFLLSSFQKIIFPYSMILSVSIILLSLSFVSYRLLNMSKAKIKDPIFLLIFLLAFSLAGILINQTPSDAYLPILFPFIILVEAIFINMLFSIGKLKLISGIFLFMIVFLNTYSSYSYNLKSDLGLKLKAVKEIINLSNQKDFNLVGIGPGSQFRSFTMSYEYLLWWKKHPPSSKSEKFKIYISEDSSGIHIKSN